MAQLVKHMPHKCGGLRSDFQNPYRKPGMVVSDCSPSSWEERGRALEVGEPEGLAYVVKLPGYV